MINHFPWLVVLLAALCSSQTTPTSPCPNVFMYEPPGTEPGRWYGVVNLSTDITLHSLWLNIVLDSKADILGNWVGDVTTTDNTDFKIENTKLKIQPGPATAIRFFVQYSPLNKAPKLQTIRLNGREICSATSARPAVERPAQDNSNNGHETTASRPQSRPQTRPQDRPITENIYNSRPASSETPVYNPTQNPPIEESNANPYSIVGDQNPTQSVGSQTNNKRPKPRPTTTSRPSTVLVTRPTTGFYTTAQPRPGAQSTSISSGSGYNDDDFVDNDSKPSDSEYFGGGLVTVITGGNSNPGGNNMYETQNKNTKNCGRVIRNANPNPLVVNGKATYEGQWPWQIALYQTQTVDNKYICGGTLVSQRHVITAAHCVARKNSNRVVNKNTLTVYLGKHNLRTSVDGVQIRLVAQIQVHPQYNATSFGRDISILHLREDARFTDWVQPACVWPDSMVDLTNIIGRKGSVVGWGFDDKGVPTEELTLVEMPVVNQETCIRSYSEFFARFTSEYTFCAGYRDGTSVCNGDSGGGMVFEMEGSWYLRGLVSLSVARQNEYRCDPSHYVVFTDIAKFLPWIKQAMGEY